VNIASREGWHFLQMRDMFDSLLNAFLLIFDFLTSDLQASLPSRGLTIYTPRAFHPKSLREQMSYWSSHS